MNTIFLIFGLGGQEIFFIAVIILFVFGGKKIPELIKGLGSGVKSFKEGISGIEEELKDAANPKNEDKEKDKEI